MDANWSDGVPLVAAYRSGQREAVHMGSIVVVDENGRIVRSLGNPDLITYARSAMKPVSAAVCLSLSDDDLPLPQIAIMCGSHNGEPRHLDAVNDLLERAGLTTRSLLCPPDIPYDPEAALHVTTRRPEYHNCSGKHAGMLLASVRAGYRLHDYPDPEHPVQAEITRMVARMIGEKTFTVGVDGCGVPVYAMPLQRMAALYATLIHPGPLGSSPGTIRAAVAAMQADPYLVAGRGRICTAIMDALPGSIAKIGGEGLICVGLVKQGLALSLKVHDGAMRALDPAIIRALQIIGILDEPPPTLGRYANPNLLGGGRPVGELRPLFDNI